MEFNCNLHKMMGDCWRGGGGGGERKQQVLLRREGEEEKWRVERPSLNGVLARPKPKL